MRGYANNQLYTNPQQNQFEVSTVTCNPNYNQENIQMPQYVYMNSQLQQQQQQKLDQLRIRQQQQIQNRKMSKFLTIFFTIVIIFQIAMIGLYFVNMFLEGELRKLLTLVVIGILCLKIFFFLLLKWRHKIDEDQVIKITLLTFSCFSLFGGAVAAYTQIWYIVLIIWGVSIVLILAVSIWGSSLHDNILVPLVCYGLFSFCIICTGTQMFITALNESIFLYYSITTLVLYGLALKLVFILLIQQGLECQCDNDRDEIQTVFLTFCFAYFNIYGICFSATSIWIFRYSFFYLTAPINVVFLIVTAYYFWKVAQFQSNQKKPQIIVYVNSDLLNSNRNNLLNSEINKPLTLCTVCQKQQSRFYYESCMHLCCGYQCILTWLSTKTKECPQCGVSSQAIVEIRRMEDSECEVGHRYRLLERIQN